MVDRSPHSPRDVITPLILLLTGLLLTGLPSIAAGQLASCEMGAAHPDAPPETRQFEFLVGNWTVRMRRADEGGEWSEQAREAYWEGRYILGGFAIADYWYDAPPDGEGPAPGRGVNVRMYDPEQGLWEMTWQHTDLSGVRRLRARKEGDRVVMWQLNEDGSRFEARRTAFHDISENSWKRTDWFSQDGGATWRKALLLEATRVPCR